MYRHIVVAFDRSPLAREALSAAAWLAWRCDGEIDLLEAVRPPLPLLTPRPLPGVAQAETEALMNDLAERKTQLSHEAQRLRESGIRANGVAIPGAPAGAILEYTRRFRADLIAMGTHSRSLAERWLLGSVAMEVIHHAPVPVLIVPRQARFRHEEQLRVLVALDGSELSEKALAGALMLTYTVPTSLTLFEVMPGEAPAPEERTPEWYATPVIGAGDYLDSLCTHLGGQGQTCERAFSAGDPANEILDYAEHGEFDLIAVSSHGRTGLDRVLLGSVAERIIRRANVPVLVAARSSLPSLEAQSRMAARA